LLVVRSASAAPCDLTTERHDEAAHFERWRIGWTVAYGALTAGQAGLALARWNPLGTYDRQFRDTLVVGAVESGLGTLAMVLAPRIADDTPCAKAGALERTLFWSSHAGNLVVNAAGSLILAHETTWSAGVVSFALGYPIGLLSTYTMPRGAWHAMRIVPTGTGLALAGTF
jgi:hypothetical protein